MILATCSLVLLFISSFVSTQQAVTFDPQLINNEGKIIIRDMILQANCDPLSLPLRNVAIISQEDNANISSRHYLKRKLDENGNFYRGVFEICQNCTYKSDTFNSEDDHVFSVARAGDATNQIAITHQSTKGALCLSYHEKVGLIFLPCHNVVDNDMHLFQKIENNITPISATNISIGGTTNNLTLSINPTVQIIGDRSLCAIGRTNEECAVRDKSRPIFKDGQCIARTQDNCPAHQILENGECRDRRQEDCTDRKKFVNGKCSACEDLFVMVNNNCIEGCPSGQLLIYDRDGNRPQRCISPASESFKLKIVQDARPSYIGSRSGFGWNWNTFSKDASFNDAWTFKLNPSYGLFTDSSSIISVRHEKYTRDGVVWRERVQTIKDWNDPNAQIFLDSSDYGKTVRFYVKDRKDQNDCATNGPEDSLKYGFGGDCDNQARYTFKMVVTN